MDRYRTHSAISHQLADMVENYCQRKGITLFTDSDSDSISHVDRVFVNVMEEMLEGNNDADDCRFYALCNEYRSNSLKKIPLDSVYMRSSQNSQPNSDTPDVNSRKER